MIVTKRIALAISLCLAAALPCGRPAQAANVDDAAKMLVKLDEDWLAAAQQKDVSRVTSYYAEDATVYPPNESAAVGPAAAAKAWASFFAVPNFALSWKTTHAGVSGSLGFTAGTFEDSYTGSDGNMVHETGHYVCVWKKQKDGSWKAIHDIWNTDGK